MTEQDISVSGASATIFRDGPQWEPRKTATLGRFQCENAEAGAALLRQWCEMLAGEGFQAVLGPMDGDTWHAYRLVTESDGSPPFLMEPVSGPDDLAAFEQAGFVPVSNYISTRGALAGVVKEPPLQLNGIAFHNWDGNDPERLIDEVFEVSVEAFKHNPFYKPIERAVFQDMYRPVMGFLDQDLVLAARRADGTMAGFIFAVPDYAQGATPDTIIIKTYASLLPGIGRALVDNIYLAALEKGYDEIIHALMHESNASFDRSRKYGTRIFRRYALMGWEAPSS